MQANTKQQLAEINNYIEDAKYKKLEKPYIGIYKVISIWCISLFLTDLFFSIMVRLCIHYNWEFTSWYFPLHNILLLIMHIAVVIIFFISLKYVKLRYRERKFLNSWCFVPIIVCLSKLLPLFVYYINAQFILNFYNIFPIHWIVFTIGIIILYSYKKNNTYILAILINIILMVINMILTVHFYHIPYGKLDLLFYISQIIVLIESIDIYILFQLLLMYLDYKHDKKL